MHAIMYGPESFRMLHAFRLLEGIGRETCTLVVNRDFIFPELIPKATLNLQGRRNLVKTGWARPQILTTSTVSTG